MPKLNCYIKTSRKGFINVGKVSVKPNKTNDATVKWLRGFTARDFAGIPAKFEDELIFNGKRPEVIYILIQDCKLAGVFGCNRPKAKMDKYCVNAAGDEYAGF